MENSESKLVERVKRNRDMTAFRELVLAHQKRLYYMIRKIVYTHQDSEDLLQETFIKVLKNIDQLKENSRFGYWINRIAVNKALTHKRKKYERDAVSIDGDLPPEVLSDSLIDSNTGEEPIKAVQANEIRTHLELALLKLREKNRTAFVLFHLNGMSRKEIAITMDCPEVTVRTRIFRAVRDLRKHLGSYYKAFKE